MTYTTKSLRVQRGQAFSPASPSDGGDQRTVSERPSGAHSGSTYTEVGMTQRLAWPLHNDDTQIRETFH